MTNKTKCQPVDDVCTQCGCAVAMIRVCPKGPYGHLVTGDRCEQDSAVEAARLFQTSMPIGKGVSPSTRKPREPGKASQSRPGLGDATERLLSSIGITEDRVKQAKELFGLAPKCNCAKRKLWLNKISDWWRGESQGMVE